MKRRKFIKSAVPAVTLPSILNGQTLIAPGPQHILHKLAAAYTETDQVLVLVQLSGGNDGLNTVIPLDKYGILSVARNNILIPSNQVLSLSGTNATGLHPSMSHLQKLYNNGKVHIIQNVGYPEQNYSHFRSTDIWMSGSDAGQILNTGWQGRYLANEYLNYPQGYPNASMPDPLSIVIGSLVSPVFQGPSMNMAMSINDPANFYNMINGTTDPVPSSHAGHELAYIRTIADQTIQYATVIKAAASKAANKSTLWPSPKTNKLADQLKIVSQLIAGGLKTRVYLVSLSGFDTHSLQVDNANHANGAHASLLFNVSQAIEAFMDDCRLLGTADRVLGMTFSEFGRRIVSNQSGGTDHGAAAPVIMFGNKVHSGISGNSPVLPMNPSVNDNIEMEFDFRQLYTTILKDWFCLPPADVKSVMLQDFQSLGILNTNCKTTGIARDMIQHSGKNMIKVFPNPMQSVSELAFESEGGAVLIRLFDQQGREMRVLVNADYDPGIYNFTMERMQLASGIYYIRMDHKLNVQTKTLVIQ